MPIELGIGRAAGAGLLAWMGWIHLHLWASNYKHLPTIGNLFIVGFAGAVAVAAGLVLSPRRLIPAVALSGVVFVIATLSALVISLNLGLFGFHERLGAGYVHMSIWVEAGALLVLGHTTWRALPDRRPVGKPERRPAGKHVARDGSGAQGRTQI